MFLGKVGRAVMLTAAWAVGLTVVFGATGVYCVGRLVAWRGGLVDVNHVAMSLAMIGMIWWPAAAGRWVEVAVFAAAAAVFGGKLAGLDGVVARGGALAHLAMNGGMVWMLVTMPRMSMDMGGLHHSGQSWTSLLTWDVAGVLALGTGWWAVRAVRSRGHRALCCCHAASCLGMAGMLAAMTPFGN